MQMYIEHPQDFIKQVWKDSNVHIVQKQYFLGRNKFCLIDISLNHQTKPSHNLYIDSEFYRINVRKGNTLIETYHTKSKQRSKITWARKGMQQINEIKLEYLQKVTCNLSLSNDENKCFEVIFKNVTKCFKNAKRVEILKTQTVTGLNVQVSYNYEFDAWIICSNNISLLAANIKDLQIYQDQRYNMLKKIALQWFTDLKRLDDRQIKELKKTLDGFTLIGQYCGCLLFQHLIKYDKISIVWCALVDNYSEDYSVDPFQVKNIVQRFGFNFVKIKRYGSFTEKTHFFKVLQQILYKTAQSSLENHEQGMKGLIVYFVCPTIQKGQLQTKVLSSGKLKTIEYKIFTQIQQKLIQLLYKKNTQQTLLIKFDKQCIDIQKSTKRRAPQPLNYYRQILKTGFQLIKLANITEKYLKQNLLSIVKLILYVKSKNISLEKFGNQMISNNNFMSSILNIPFTNYGALACSIKVILIPVDLPKISASSLSDRMKAHFSRLNISCHKVEDQKSEIEEIFKRINYQSIPQKNPYLMSFILDIALNSSQILSLLELLKQQGNPQIHHKIILLKDKSSQNQEFQQQGNQYPFSLQTILLSYYISYQQCRNTPTIQQKIDTLRLVTHRLIQLRNFNQTITKKHIQTYLYDFSRNCNMQSTQKQEYRKLISNIISGQREYENYCRLILKLQKFDKNNWTNLSSEDIDSQILSVICNICPQVPTFNFKK